MVAVRLESMTEEQYVDYRATAEIDYGRNIAASGAMPESEAPRAPLLLGVRRGGHPGAFRRRAGQRECRDRGVVAVRLNVFGSNRGAQALYEQTGFEVTSVVMTKRLDGTPKGT